MPVSLLLARLNTARSRILYAATNIHRSVEQGPGEGGDAAAQGNEFNPITILNNASSNGEVEALTIQARGITKEIVAAIIAIGIMFMVGSFAVGAIQYAAGGTGQKSDAGKSRITKACIGAFLIGCAVSGIAWLVGQGQGVWD